ncbi:MAG TPA: 4Fe-4S binding protein [Candidatus Fermentibacter daniensis]|nr:4Fe-4S binding protein [Candidatus Fermentibacter daniensis]HOR08090.1 4Fe-4S binding protein [Candidatus Fermentibacter daniensis]HPK51682.1 4Fe-4S binding protein [Candidatus Fermentibacter daniensis]HQE56360.1 4Fe-4S binding protein [Candidatus Fermentibacter daniensis]
MKLYASSLGLLVILLAAACSGPTGQARLEVDPCLCIGCGECEEVCPYGAVEVVDGEAVIDPALCHFCLRCVEECPEGAIY